MEYLGGGSCLDLVGTLEASGIKDATDTNSLNRVRSTKATLRSSAGSYF